MIFYDLLSKLFVHCLVAEEEVFLQKIDLLLQGRSLPHLEAKAVHVFRHSLRPHPGLGHQLAYQPRIPVGQE